MLRTSGATLSSHSVKPVIVQQMSEWYDSCDPPGRTDPKRATREGAPWTDVTDATNEASDMAARIGSLCSGVHTPG
jgi:hypothetical protein